MRARVYIYNGVHVFYCILTSTLVRVIHRRVPSVMVRRVKNWVRFQFISQRADTQVIQIALLLCSLPETHVFSCKQHSHQIIKVLLGMPTINSLSKKGRKDFCEMFTEINIPIRHTCRARGDKINDWYGFYFLYMYDRVLEWQTCMTGNKLNTEPSGDGITSVPPPREHCRRNQRWTIF